MKKKIRCWVIVTSLLIPILVLPVFAGDTVGLPPPGTSAADAFPPQKHYSPYAGRNFPTQVFWGDTHLHTSNSLDARALGATLGPEEAYRFARGEEVESTTAGPARLARPGADQRPAPPGVPLGSGADVGDHRPLHHRRSL